MEQCTGRAGTGVGAKPLWNGITECNERRMRDVIRICVNSGHAAYPLEGGTSFGARRRVDFWRGCHKINCEAATLSHIYFREGNSVDKNNHLSNKILSYEGFTYMDSLLSR